MRKIKVKFIDFWKNFDENNNFIINILKKKYMVEISDEPEYLFFSGFNSSIYKYNCIKIFFAFENITPDFNLCDYAIGFDYLEFGDRYIRYPLYLVSDFTYYNNDNYENDMELALKKHLIKDEEIKNKKGFCSFVVSSAVDKVRNEFFENLSNYKEVASGGRYKNNVGGPVDNKLEFQSKYKFSIAFENSSSPGYTTEKLMQAFAAKTVPIYYGSTRISEEFNNKAFIDCSEFEDFESVIKRVIEIDNDESLYISMIKQPAFVEGFSFEEKKQELEEFLYNIIEQEPKLAVRRNISDFGKKYENKYRRVTQIYVKLLKLKIGIVNFIKKFKIQLRR